MKRGRAIRAGSSAAIAEETSTGVPRPQLFANDVTGALAACGIADVVIDVAKELVHHVEFRANDVVFVVLEPSQVVFLRLVGRDVSPIVKR